MMAVINGIPSVKEISVSVFQAETEKHDNKSNAYEDR
jgi:hypothetical protein